MNAQWYFKEHGPQDSIWNPMGGEHLTGGEDDDWRAGESLVRECIQNSIDASEQSGEIAEIRFRVGASGALSAQTALHWFGTLWPHLVAEDCRLTGVPQKPAAGGYLVIEDFGTCGLEGDVTQYGISDESNRFLNFVRAEGLSGNSVNGNSGGSWGVGKSVFNRCSRINSFLGLTVRKSSGDAVLFGKSLLRHHRMCDEQFQAMGLFGLRKDDASLTLPPDDTETLERLVADFGITRELGLKPGMDAEPGLSVVVPYADEEIDARALAEVVIKEYFYPIVSGRLKVSITEEKGGRTRVIELHQETIRDLELVQSNRELNRLLTLADWAYQYPLAKQYQLESQTVSKRPSWSDDLFRLDSDEFKALSERYEDGYPIAVRVPVPVYKKGEQPTEASLTVYLQKDLEGAGYRPVFVRGWIVVPNARQQRVRSHALFGLIRIDDGPLAWQLRAAEPPAHTYWSPDTANFKGRYKHGKAVIDFVVAAPKKIADALSSANTERDFNALAELFPEPTPEGRRKNENGNMGEKKKGKSPFDGVDPPKPRPKPFKISDRASGFTVSRDNPETTPIPWRMEIKAAYDTSRGNPMKKFHPADFDLEKLDRSQHGVQEIECAPNAVVIEPDSDDFRYSVEGFDVHRDLVVKVSTLKAPEGDET